MNRLSTDLPQAGILLMRFLGSRTCHSLLRGLVVTVSLAGSVSGLLCSGCGSREVPVPAPPVVGPALLSKATVGIQIPEVRFTDITDRAGIRFQHTNGAFGKQLLPE